MPSTMTTIIKLPTSQSNTVTLVMVDQLRKKFRERCHHSTMESFIITFTDNVKGNRCFQIMSKTEKRKKWRHKVFFRQQRYIWDVDKIKKTVEDVILGFGKH